MVNGTSTWRGRIIRKLVSFVMGCALFVGIIGAAYYFVNSTLDRRSTGASTNKVESVDLKAIEGEKSWRWTGFRSWYSKGE